MTFISVYARAHPPLYPPCVRAHTAGLEGRPVCSLARGVCRLCVRARKC